MLTIRTAQIERMQAQARASFGDRMVQRLQAHSAGNGGGPANDQLKADVETLMAKAAQYGIRREDDVARLIDILWAAHGSLTTELPETAQAVLHSWSDPQTKLDRLQRVAGGQLPPDSEDASPASASPEGQGDGREIGAAVLSCPLGAPQHWIEIELIGEDDKGIPGFGYSLELPDGTLVQGNLDETGFVRLDRLPSGGSCKVSFPALDQEAWSFVKAAAAREAAV